MKLEELIERIAEKNAIHGKKLHKNFNALKGKDNFLQDYERFIEKYRCILEKKELTLNHSIDYYLKMIEDFNEETLDFARNGVYRNTSFDEVNKAMYDNPDVMVSHMHGLLLSQFLWKHHYEVYEFFKNNLENYQPIQTYLEIGAGHGLYLEAAIEKLGNDCNYEALDISKSSIELTQSLIKNENITYYLQDVFDLESEAKKDFITMGEVLEHVENPLALLQKLKTLIKESGNIFITTPTNAPSIDHIYLFNNVQEIRELIYKSGLKIDKEACFVSEDMDMEKAEKRKVATLYAAFLKI